MRKPIRVAVVQLESRPAVRIGDVDYLAEPAIPHSAAEAMAALARSSPRIRTALELSRARYIAWQRQRIDSVCQALTKLNCDIVIFPECGVPQESLPDLAQFARDADLTVIAGTHAPNCAESGRQIYTDARLSSTQFTQLAVPACESDQAVLPVISPGHTDIYVKSIPSAFESTNRSPSASTVVTPRVLYLRQDPTSYVVFVCSEATALPSYEQRPDFAIICAYEAAPSRFDDHVGMLRAQGCPTILCNDGAFGGSGVFGLVDTRMGDTWFHDPPLDGRLPTGNCLLVFDVDLEVRAIERGIVAPRRQLSLQSIMPIIAADELETTRNEENARACLEIGNVAQLTDLVAVLESSGAPRASTLRWRYIEALLRAGKRIPPDEQTRLGGVVVTTDAPRLRTIEREAKGHLLPELESATRNSRETARFGESGIVLLVKAANRLRDELDGAALPDRGGGGVHLQAPTAFDQEGLQASTSEFLLRGTAALLLMTGLPGSGKSTVIASCLARTRSRVVRILCAPGRTWESVCTEIIAAAGGAVRDFDPTRVEGARFEDALRATDVLWLDGAHNLCDTNAVNGVELTRLCAMFAESFARGTRTRVILESRQYVELPHMLSGSVLRRRVRGFREEDALTYLEIQLRQADVSLDASDLDERRELVRLLDGHAGLINIAAESCTLKPLRQLLLELRARRGFFNTLRERLLDGLKLGPPAQAIVYLLGETRLPVPAEVLAAGFRGASLDDPLAWLAARGLVQLGPDGYQMIAVLRGVRQPAASPEVSDTAAFHRAAAEHHARRARLAAPDVGLRAMIEANYHASKVGDAVLFDTRAALDGVLGSARTAYDEEDFESVQRILAPLIQSSGVGANRSAGAMYIDAIAWLGELQEALRLADELVALDYRSSWLYLEIARAAMHAARYDKARSAIARAYEIGGESSQGEVILGTLAVIERCHADADHHFGRAAALAERSHNPWAYFYYARHLARRGRDQEALEVVRKSQQMIRRARGTISGALETALITVKMSVAVSRGDDATLRETVGMLESRSRLRPEAAVMVAYARSHLSAGRGSINTLDAFERAIQRLSEADSRQRHTQAQICMYRGKLLEELGDLEGAAAELEKAVALDPDNHHMRVVLIRVLRARVESMAPGPTRSALMQRLRELE